MFAAIISAAATLIAATIAQETCDVLKFQPILLLNETSRCLSDSGYVMTSLATPTDDQIDIMCTNPACQAILAETKNVAPVECFLGEFALYGDLLDPVTNRCADNGVTLQTTGNQTTTDTPATMETPTTTETSTTIETPTTTGTTLTTGALLTSGQSTTGTPSTTETPPTSEARSTTRDTSTGEASRAAGFSGNFSSMDNNVVESSNSSVPPETRASNSSPSVAAVSAGAVVAAVVATFFF